MRHLTVNSYCHQIHASGFARRVGLIQLASLLTLAEIVRAQVTKSLSNEEILPS
jgi:hypothetical protein